MLGLCPSLQRLRALVKRHDVLKNYLKNHVSREFGLYDPKRIWTRLNNVTFSDIPSLLCWCW